MISATSLRSLGVVILHKTSVILDCSSKSSHITNEEKKKMSVSNAGERDDSHSQMQKELTAALEEMAGEFLAADTKAFDLIGKTQVQNITNHAPYCRRLHSHKPLPVRYLRDDPLPVLLLAIGSTAQNAHSLLKVERHGK
eukprot:Opistho-2@57920